MNVSLFDALEIDNTERRVSSRRALALAHNRVERNLGRFLRAAQSEEEFVERLALIQDDFAGYVATASREVGHEHPEHIAAALRDHYRLAVDHVNFEKTPLQKEDEEGEKALDEGLTEDGQRVPHRPSSLEEEKKEAKRTWSMIKEAPAQQRLPNAWEEGRTGCPECGSEITEHGECPTCGWSQRAEGAPDRQWVDNPQIQLHQEYPRGYIVASEDEQSRPLVRRAAPGPLERYQGPQGVTDADPHSPNAYWEEEDNRAEQERAWEQEQLAEMAAENAWRNQGFHGADEVPPGHPDQLDYMGGDPEGGQPCPHGPHWRHCPACNPSHMAADNGSEKVTCPECGGDGKTEGDTECPKCHGAGKVNNFGPSVLDKLEGHVGGAEDAYAGGAGGYELPNQSQDGPTKTWPCAKCGAMVERWPGEGDVQCPHCGTEYNAFGQRLAPRSQWGEETGESYGDIHGPDPERLGWPYEGKTGDGNTGLDGPEPKMDKSQWTRENPGEPKIKDDAHHKTVRKDPVDVIGPMRNDHWPLKEVGDIEKKDLPSSTDAFADNNMDQGPHTKTFGDGSQVDPVTHETLSYAYRLATQKFAMGMSAQDFRMLAEAIRTAPEGADKGALATHVAQYLQHTNPLFDADRFLAAAIGEPTSGRDQYRGPDVPYSDPAAAGGISGEAGRSEGVMSHTWPSDFAVEKALSE